MEITYQILLDELPVRLTDYSAGKNREFKSVEIYSGDSSGLSGSTLYIADLKTACQLSCDEQLYFFCPYSKDAAGSIVSPNCIAVAETESRLERIAAVTVNTYIRLNRWIVDMQQSVLEGDGVQALVDLSEDVLGNTITVTDSAFKLLAYSHGHLPTDEMNAYLINKGYHSEEAMARLQQYNRFQETDSPNDIVVNRDLYTSKFVTAQKAHRYHGMLSASVMMLCNYREVSDGLLDLFRIFNSYIALYVKRGYPHNGKHSAFDLLVNSLLNGDMDSLDEMGKKAARAELTVEGLFNIYKIELLEKPVQSPAYIVLNLSRNIPDSRVTLYCGSIIVLNIFGGPDECEQRLRDNIEIIRSSTNGSVKAVGVSNRFDSLTGFRCAYIQAETALRTPEMDVLPQSAGDFPVREFEECYLRHIICQADDTENVRIYDNTAAAKAVRSIDSYDKANNTSYVQLLATYLLCERRATEAGAKLHLHRNTVIYHITKIEELFGLDFDDSMFRIKLLAEITRYKMEGQGK